MKTKSIHLYNIIPKAINCIRKDTESFSLHWHSFYEIEIVLSGKGTHILNGKHYEWRRGEMHLTRLSDVHEGRLSESSTVYNIQFAPSRMSEALVRRIGMESGNLVTYLSEEDLLTVEELCHTLLRVSADKTEAGQLMGEYIISAILAAFFRAYGGDGARVSEASERIAEVISFIGEHFRERLTLSDIAAAVPMNKNYLCTYFKEIIGVSPMTYIRDLRLEYAARLVKTTGLRSIDVCDECGYGSISHFLRDFKERYGMTPTEMREVEKQNGAASRT